MIVYLAKKHEFLDDVDSNRIEERIQAEFRRTHNHSVGASEKASWKNSLGFMQRILADEEIPHDSGVAIELSVPLSAKRIDFVLTGTSREKRQTAIIIELKQWTEAKPTQKDAIVRTYLGGAEVETSHPSYQAWSYAALLEDYSETVRTQRISLKPCAYLHNCADGSTINNPFYREHTDKAPAFLQADAAKLRAFIKEHVKHGDSGKVIYQIRDGKISPSKNLADSLVSLLQGNREFLMIDDQKLVYETALQLAGIATPKQKQVLIVEGGPGTGKSVVAVNLLVALTARKMLTQYVTKNAAPRGVYESRLTGAFKKSHISNLFVGSGGFTETPPNTFGALVVDEAHRLNEKSGLFMNLGENQVKEIIQAACFSVFFLDENQRVTLKDIGSVSEIMRWATATGAKVSRLNLESQFRCNGSDGYLAWVDNTLQVKKNANPTLEGIDYDFAVCDSPNELRERILQKNAGRNKSRMVAGYCWDWKSKTDGKSPDIEFPEHGFSARWNLTADGPLWIIKPETVTEIGCIHTCQGLELEYVGVIIGPDLVVRDGRIKTDPAKRSGQDSSIKGFKKRLSENREAAEAATDEIIKNTYRTLMTRGQHGCFVYSADPETNAYLKAMASRKRSIATVEPTAYPGLPLRILDGAAAKPFINAVPLYDLQVAAGAFSLEQSVGDCAWVELPDAFTPRKDLFVTRVVGESMNRRIPNGSWCLFKRTPAGSRDGKVVLVELLDRQDPESGGRYTVKVYRSQKQPTEDSWEHTKIILKPDSTNAGFNDIVLEPSETESFKTIGELVAVLGKD
ncbi:DUF2075 domain-containing protein [Oleiharenicola lentus]|uniref:DUF2075 domain-containing protein n=1 Tax=Oleiharenicola lentus TaxID=2508720 RepID=A0A4Q1C5D5_9BACT|nr:DNA/RNA helicase domain-containing protein [Oleiharenicola lentus]RXK53654.1 DUF2075 domain-containing protein [Oleiharenicola lentus]